MSCQEQLHSPHSGNNGMNTGCHPHHCLNSIYRISRSCSSTETPKGNPIHCTLNQSKYYFMYPTQQLSLLRDNYSQSSLNKWTLSGSYRRVLFHNPVLSYFSFTSVFFSSFS